MLLTTALITSLAAETEKLAPTFAPPFIIAGLAAIFFTFLGFVTFSYKNVSNRQAPVVHPEPSHETGIDEFGHPEEH
jgi:hypothetical protein